MDNSIQVLNQNPAIPLNKVNREHNQLAMLFPLGYKKATSDVKPLLDRLVVIDYSFADKVIYFMHRLIHAGNHPTLQQAYDSRNVAVLKGVLRNTTPTQEEVKTVIGAAYKARRFDVIYLLLENTEHKSCVDGKFLTTLFREICDNDISRPALIEFWYELLKRDVGKDFNPIESLMKNIESPHEKQKALFQMVVLFGQEKEIFELILQQFESHIEDADFSLFLNRIYPHLNEDQQINLLVAAAKFKDKIGLFAATLEVVSQNNPQLYQNVFKKLEGEESRVARLSLLGMAVVDETLRDNLFPSALEGAKASAKEGCFDVARLYLLKEGGNALIDPTNPRVQETALRLKEKLKQRDQEALELRDFVVEISELPEITTKYELQKYAGDLWEKNSEDVFYLDVLNYVNGLVQEENIGRLYSEIDEIEKRLEVLDRPQSTISKAFLEELLELALTVKAETSDLKGEDFAHFLIGNGAGNVCIGEQGETALRLALRENFKEEVILALIQSGENLDKAPMNGQAPIVVAIKNGKTEFVKALLEKGVSPNTKDKEGNSLFHLVLQQENAGSRMCSLLLSQKDLDSDAVDSKDVSPIAKVYHKWKASKEGSAEGMYHEQLFQVLKRKGAKIVTAPDSEGRSLLTYAIHHKDVSLVEEIFKSPDFDLSLYLLNAWRSPKKGRMRACIQFISEDLKGKGFNWNLSHKEGTLLALAIQEGEEEMAKFILSVLSLESQASIRKETLLRHRSGKSSLALACEKGMVDVVKGIVDLMPEDLRKQLKTNGKLLEVVPQEKRGAIQAIVAPTITERAKGMALRGRDFVQDVLKNMSVN